jgi:hypothetical protein
MRARVGVVVVAMVLGCGRDGRSRATTGGGSGGAGGDGGGGSSSASTTSSSEASGGTGGATTSSTSATSSSADASSSSSTTASSSSSSGGGCGSPAECPAGECEDATCVSGVCGVDLKAIGTACSTGLCQNGACVDFIPVVCKVGNMTYSACDGVDHNWEIYWFVMNMGHICFAHDTMQADYCAPGTDCAVSVNGGPLQQGKCQ